MKRWIHKTRRENAKRIVEEGFRFGDTEGRFGKAVYFMSSLDFDYCVEDTVLISALIDAPILALFHSEICEVFKEYNLLPEEEGIVLLKDYVIEKGYKAVEVKYEDGTSELVVYSLDVIQDVRLDEYRGIFGDSQGIENFLWLLRDRRLIGDTFDIISKLEKRIDEPYIYRGIMYNRYDMVAGRPYSHWDSISSWSKDMGYATKFVCSDKYVPEGILEECMDRYNCTMDEAMELFCAIVLKLPNPVGIDLEQIIMDNDIEEIEEGYLKEREVVVLDKVMVIKRITKVYSSECGTYYYIVDVDCLDMENQTEIAI